MKAGKKGKRKIKRTLKVGPSGIHGTGLFASKPIAADVVLGKLRTRTARRNGPYVLTTDAGRYRVLCKLRYINHSKSPNVAYVDDLTVIALRNIEAGEELTHDYGDDWD
ncbi:MAG: SET domain-containing protein-lysine N-methyltransferase [Pseudomonadota bacterium]